MDEIVIRKPVEYNNTKLLDFVANNKYKVKDPNKLEEMMISADTTEFCSMKEKHSKIVSKPPGLYQAINNRRKQNTCVSEELITKNGKHSLKFWSSDKMNREGTSERFETTNQIKLSFKVIMNAFKVSLDFQKN